MNCPVCENQALVMSERQGIEIDYCPQCRGVWLDRGELDKIIERSSESIKPTASTPPPATSQAQPPQGHHPLRHDSDYGKYRYKKRKSWLSELFD